MNSVDLVGDKRLWCNFLYVDSPRDSVQFIECSPTSCPRALLIANFHGRITIWTQPTQVCAPDHWDLPLYFFFVFCVKMFYDTLRWFFFCGLVLQGSANLVHDATSWQCEHEWRQDIAVVTKWLTGASPVCNLMFCLFAILSNAQHICPLMSSLN